MNFHNTSQQGTTENPSTNLTLNSTTLSHAVQLDDGTYYWKVVASNGEEMGARESEINSFTVCATLISR